MHSLCELPGLVGRSLDKWRALLAKGSILIFILTNFLADANVHRHIPIVIISTDKYFDIWYLKNKEKRSLHKKDMYMTLYKYMYCEAGLHFIIYLFI